MNWPQYIQSFQNYLKLERGLSKNTLVNYAFDLQKLTQFLEVHYPSTTPRSISREIIEAFIYDVSKQINARSQSRLLSGLRSFFTYLIYENVREDHPMELIETPKIGRKLPDTLTMQEIDQLIAAVDLSKAEGERNRAMLETLYGCGLRVSELTTLKISDLFFEEGFIKITGKGNKQRFVPIGPHTQKYIELYVGKVRILQKPVKGHEDIIFLNRRGRALTRAMIFTIIRQLSTTIGLQKTISPHTFRHSFATHLLENGADLRSIQLMMGHESITTTEVYVHLDRKHLSKIVNTFHPRAGK